MSLIALLVGVLGLLAIAAVVALLLPERLGLHLSTILTVVACGLGTLAASTALWHGAHVGLSAEWSLPLGSFHIALDELSAFFLLCIFLISSLAAIYGAGALRRELGLRPLRSALVCFPVLVGAMAVVALAHDAVLFLIAWEVMSFASFFLVSFEHQQSKVRSASYTYLVASHLGVVFLFVLFAQLGAAAGNFDFDSLMQLGRGAVPFGSANVCFVLALIGFGTKAGLFPLHMWVPQTYSAAPGHIAAVMSGVMSKLGIYGLLRVLGFLGAPDSSWGVVLLCLGAFSGLFGIVSALAQHELKRVIAYSSIENLGIICMGLGLGLLGDSQKNALLSYWGFTGAILHVLHHGFMKGLLFLCAGSVQQATREDSLNRLGGLLSRMPWTGALFLCGSLAISALPSLCGFVGEWFLYIGAFVGGSGPFSLSALLCILVLPTLALIGGLCALTFVRAFGIGFLGTPRSLAAEQARESDALCQVPMRLLGLGCLLLGLWPLLGVNLASRVTLGLGPLLQITMAWPGRGLLSPLVGITTTCGVLLALSLLLWGLRRGLLLNRSIETGPTWGCGYARPSSRMQYTATSFSALVLRLFAGLIPREIKGQAPQGPFPSKTHYEEQVYDLADKHLIAPSRSRGLAIIQFLRGLQKGRLQTYLVYILVTLLGLLIWQLAGLKTR